MRNTKNPFVYWGVVGEDAFCNRQQELNDLLGIMRNSGRVFIYSERRYGKTSLIKLALKKLPKKKFIPVYIDLMPTDGAVEFITTVAKAITESLSTSFEKAFGAAKHLFSHLRPAITLDEDRKPLLTFGLAKSSHVELELEEVLHAAEKLGRRGKKVVVVFDEFQQVLAYRGEAVEQRLRSIIQHHKHVAYVFMGSRKHTLQRMFLDKSQPLYRSAAHYPLRPIGEAHWIPFIMERFHSFKMRIDEDTIRSLLALTEGHPFYTQHLCYVVWEICEHGNPVSDRHVHEALETVLAREQYAYTLIWDGLTLNQQRFLKAIAAEDKGAKPFSAEFLQRHRLGSASSAQRVTGMLMERDLVDQQHGSFVIIDRFFRLWIRRFPPAA